ncbi:MAG: CBS domain-containing protein, partial [Anaerolineaceae bacterium]|nr:CBS domain-containing protein [Anaerolineaceae bacterium]
LLLPLIFFWPVILGGKTLLPADNLFAYEPWRTFATSLGVGVPHNELLSDLILAKPDAPISEFMHKRVVTVNLEDSQEDVARVIARYNLMSVPVVDEFDVMQGIVTADDALDKIIPTAWKKRLPRFYR